ncbi:MAG TPA: hypothetical protein VKM93_12060 [Terriglobia bacterium]|nr:hypothetical protein [Terriglobia bacterium]
MDQQVVGPPKTYKARVLNLENGLPTVDEGRKRLLEEVKRNKQDGAVLKVIHGYGSSGTGGKLREGVRKSLLLRRKEGAIQAYVWGENWDAFDETARLILDRCPDLRRDPDLARGNPGITIVLV